MEPLPAVPNLEYQRFLSLHQTQLQHFEVPVTLWAHLFKVSQGSPTFTNTLAKGGPGAKQALWAIKSRLANEKSVPLFCRSTELQ
jgi:hypothetical protein